MHRKISAVVAFLHITSTSRLLEVLKGDTKAIFTAASLATRTVDYLLGLQPKAEPVQATDPSGDPERPQADGAADRLAPKGPR